MSWNDVGWAPGLQIECAIKFSGSTWTDVTAYLREFSTDISRSRALGVFPPGRGSVVLDNRDGRFTPLNSSGPYYGNLLPGRHVRLQTRYSGTSYSLWYGIIEDWGDKYPQAKDGIATLQAIQPSVLLTRWRGMPTYTAGVIDTVGEGDDAATRINRVVVASGYTLGSTLNYGVVPMQPTDLASDGMTIIDEAVQTEGGAFWCEPSGEVYLDGRYALIERTRSNTSQATFGPGAGEIPYVVDPGLEMSNGMDLVINQVTAADRGRLATTVWSSASFTSLAAVEAISETDLRGSLNSYTWAEATAAQIVYMYATPYQHPMSITLRPAGAPSVSWPQAFARKIRDKVTVKVPTPWGSTLTCPCWIVGVSHRTIPGDWLTTFYLEPANALESTGFGKVDSAVVDTSKVAF